MNTSAFKKLTHIMLPLLNKSTLNRSFIFNKFLGDLTALADIKISKQ